MQTTSAPWRGSSTEGKASKLYVYIVAGAGALASALSLPELVSGSVTSHWVILAALTEPPRVCERAH